MHRGVSAIETVTQMIKRLECECSIDPKDEALHKISELVAAVSNLNTTPTAAINSIGRILVTLDREVSLAARS